MSGNVRFLTLVEPAISIPDLSRFRTLVAIPDPGCDSDSAVAVDAQATAPAAACDSGPWLSLRLVEPAIPIPDLSRFRTLVEPVGRMD